MFFLDKMCAIMSQKKRKNLQRSLCMDPHHSPVRSIYEKKYVFEKMEHFLSHM